jgi:hypothetical protein
LERLARVFISNGDKRGIEQGSGETEKERECVCERWLMAAIALIVNGPLENTSVEINKIISICECDIN